MTNQDQMINCPVCDGDACYKTPVNESAHTYFCFSCGYVTNDLQKVDDFDIEAYEQTLPELYKDAKIVDEESRIWYPAAINVPEKGTVFLNLTPEKLTSWCSIKVRPLTAEEKKELSNKGIKYKSDASTMKFFGGDFIECLDSIGFFAEPEKTKK